MHVEDEGIRVKAREIIINLLQQKGQAEKITSQHKEGIMRMLVEALSTAKSPKLVVLACNAIEICSTCADDNALWLCSPSVGTMTVLVRRFNTTDKKMNLTPLSVIAAVTRVLLTFTRQQENIAILQDPQYD